MRAHADSHSHFGLEKKEKVFSGHALRSSTVTGYVEDLSMAKEKSAADLLIKTPCILC
jgi:hypothetical protein